MVELVRSDAPVEELLQSGKEFLDQRRFAEAEWQFTQARDREPDNPDVYYCIGLLFADLARPTEALAAFDRTLALDDAHAKAHNNRGSALQQLDRLPEAEAAYRRALELVPNQALPYVNLANVVDQQFRTAEALKIYDLALSRGVDPELIGQYRSSLLGKATTRSPDAWVKSTFDNFAPTFDEHLRGLKYVVPDAIAQMLERRVTPGSRVLDLGCGTGWVGASLKPLGLSLVGVDLSERMLVQARGREAYVELHAQEAHAFLASTATASYDAVVAADVFIYIGQLGQLFAHVLRILRPGGFFAFSVEEASGPDYVLQNTGRYAHSPAYIRRLAAFRFASLEDRAGAIRLERGQPLHGRVHLMQTGQFAKRES